MSRRTTIKDIAKRSGYSIATVSRVINNKGQFYTENTKRKIMETVEELSYKPNLNAKGLKENKTYSIAFVVPQIDDFYLLIYNNIHEEAVKRGYSISILSSNYDPKLELINISLVREKEYDGVIIATGLLNSFKDEDIESIFGDIPIVMIEALSKSNKVASVCVNVEVLCYKAIKYLIDNGHRKIAYVSAPLRFQTLQQRYKGYLKALKDNHIPVDERRIIFNNELERANYQGSYNFMRKTIENGDFTAMMINSDWAAFTAIKAAKELGRRVPEDLSIIGFDNLSFTDFSEPPLTTVSQNPEQTGKSSIKLLFDLMRNEPVNNVIVEGSIVFRNSVSRI